MKDQSSESPSPLKWISGVVVAGALLAAGSVYDLFTWRFLLLLLLLLLVLVGGYLLVRYGIRRRKSERMRGEILYAPVGPATVSDPQDLARLDELKKKFLKGIEQYRRLGRDLYVVPWFLIAGESGSGKTQAVRHSDLSFPPGMQEDYQGVGGTIGMDWWFTNHAVLIDTAGSLVFEKVKPGETGAWREFLGLLRKHRPRCPINGLLLVIPADSLIKDSLNVVSEKAQLLARQLQIIQRELDVCFPVFVIVTKSDLISGYREFFQNLGNPLQHQILGWSNPEPIDEIARADAKHLDAEAHERSLKEQVTAGLDAMTAQIKRHRLGMLREPTPADPKDRRAGEVDSLYAFPRNLQKLEEPLWIYLRHIFARGPFFRPVFFRGIYFNSSMQEGAALDQQLAEALRLPVGELPGGSGFKQERALFLRDLFREKVFPESGLVVRATDALRQLRAWQVAFYCCAFGAVILWVVLAGFGMSSLKQSVGTQRDYWNQVSDGWHPYRGTNVQIWQEIVDPANHEYRGDLRGLKADGRKVSLVEFHALLRDQAEKPLKVKWVFKPLEFLLRQDLDRRRAQRIAFEGSVVKPLLLMTRDKLQAPRDPKTDDERLTEKELAHHVAAIQSLMRLEARIQGRQSGATRRLTQSEAAKEFLDPWLNFVTVSPPGQGARTNLAATMERTYAGTDEWPPPVSQGFSLAENAAISSGIARLMRHVRAGLTGGENRREMTRLNTLFQDYRRAEDAYVDVLRSGKSGSQFYVALTNEATRLESALAGARAPGGLLAGATDSALTAYESSRTNAQRNFDVAFKEIELLAQLLLLGEGKGMPLLTDISTQLANFRQTEVLRPFEGDESLTRDLRAFDRIYLRSYGRENKPLFKIRLDAYTLARDLGRFPLVLTGDTHSLSVSEVQKAGLTLENLKQSLTTNDLPLEHSGALQPLEKKLKELQPIARSLLTPSNTIATCTIRVLTKDPKFPEPNGWRGIQFAAPGVDSPRAYIGHSPILGTVGLDQPFGIKILDNPNSDTPQTQALVEPGRDWTLLRWLHDQASNAKRLDGGTNWVLTIPVREPLKPITNYVRFGLEFSTSAPELSQWPRGESVGPPAVVP